jgi:hypothetical protein
MSIKYNNGTSVSSSKCHPPGNNDLGAFVNGSLCRKVQELQ